MIISKQIIFNFQAGVDDALVAIVDEIKNGYTVKSIYKKDPGISCCEATNMKALWVAELVNTKCPWSET